MRCRRIRALRLFLRTACIESEQTFTVPSLRSHCCRKQLGLPTALRSLELCWEACGTYRTARTSAHPGYRQRNKPTDNHRSRRSGQSAPLSRQTPLCTDPELSRLRCDILRTAPRRPARPNAPLLFGLPMSHGGYALGIPRNELSHTRIHGSSNRHRQAILPWRHGLARREAHP